MRATLCARGAKLEPRRPAAHPEAAAAGTVSSEWHGPIPGAPELTGDFVK
jgi:hypothetical protein